MEELLIKILDIAFSGFWAFVGMTILLNGLAFFFVNGVLRLFSRTYRMVMVSFRGWPPSHLDADGDHPITKIIKK